MNTTTESIRCLLERTTRVDRQEEGSTSLREIVVEPAFGPSSPVRSCNLTEALRQASHPTDTASGANSSPNWPPTAALGSSAVDPTSPALVCPPSVRGLSDDPATLQHNLDALGHVQLQVHQPRASLSQTANACFPPRPLANPTTLLSSARGGVAKRRISGTVLPVTEQICPSLGHSATPSLGLTPPGSRVVGAAFVSGYPRAVGRAVPPSAHMTPSLGHPATSGPPFPVAPQHGRPTHSCLTPGQGSEEGRFSISQAILIVAKPPTRL
ncbi:unnamed protein product [Protopolystoma xenopodis]|uniref:Uncharacterized protein n=1 Tax=Protopolystoma xenopodis TaxID=117903 RepID=A0A448WRW8_9PLAT|nr:unnamed protein product [Protopolystoma xenopodis]